MSDAKPILFAGGGTGGHLYPGIAVAEALRASGSPYSPLFLCTTREIDRVILQPTGFEFIPQPIFPPVKTIGGLLKFWKGWRETKDLLKQVLKDRQPAAVLGLGGYAAGVAVKMAAERGIPAAILNPDVIPGAANQFLMKHSRAICCQFSETIEHVPAEHRDKIRVTGCPIRADILKPVDRAESLARLELNPMLSTLVVTGASLGAKTVNDAVLSWLGGTTLQGWQVLHLAGRDHATAVKAGYRDLNVTARVIDFTPAMTDVWAVADLCVSRSGASSCAELTACGVPSLLMPYPFHKDMHQRANADVLAKGGAAILIDDEKSAAKNTPKLKAEIEPLLHDGVKRKTMADAAKAMGRPDAAAAVADVLMKMIEA